MGSSVTGSRDRVYERITQLEAKRKPADAEIRQAVSSYLSFLIHDVGPKDYTLKDLKVVRRAREYEMEEEVERLRESLGDTPDDPVRSNLEGSSEDRDLDTDWIDKPLNRLQQNRVKIISTIPLRCVALARS